MRRRRRQVEAGAGCPRISFVARRDNLHTMQNWLPDWAPELAVRIYDYETLPAAAVLPSGLWIFADTERLTPACLATGMAAQVAKYGRRVRMLNRPGGSLTRKQLLDRLFAAGRNGFAVHAARDRARVSRFPVFVRLGAEHFGALTPLLHDPAALEAGIETVRAMGYPLDDMLVVEFIDTSVDGVFRKYSVFRAGGTFLAQHVFHARDWHVKASTETEEEVFVEEDQVFRTTNPHLPAVRAAFDLAGLEYGRIDYAVRRGRVQVWEINSNPTIMYPRAEYRPEQLPAKLWFAATLAGALRAMAQGGP